MIRIPLLALLCIALVDGTDARTVDPVSATYTEWRTITRREGLPSDDIRAMVIRDDAVWVGTDNGLARWDGTSWKAWTASDGLPCASISAIDVDPVTRDVWLGTLGGGLIRLTAGRFDQFHQFNSGLAGDIVFAVAMAGGRIWAATNAGLCSYDAVRDEWNLYAERRADAPETAIVGLFVADGRLFAASWCDVLRELDLESARWTRIAPSRDADAAGKDQQLDRKLSLRAACMDADCLWWADEDRLFRRAKTGRWQSRRIAPFGPDEVTVRCIGVGADVSIWLGTDDGLRILKSPADDTWIAVRRASSPPHTRIDAIREGRVHSAHKVADMLPDNRIACIAFDQTGVWIGTRAGLLRGSSRKDWRLRTIAHLPSMGIGPNRQSDAPGAAASATAEAIRPTVAAPAVGVFAPVTRTLALPGAPSSTARSRDVADLDAVRRAVDVANARGGYRGTTAFQFVTGRQGFDRYAWGTPEDDLTYFADRGDVCGLVAALRPDSCIASAVLARTRIPVVNASAATPSPDEIASGWIFRCRVSDPRVHEQLIDCLIDELAARRLAVLRTPGRLTRARLEWQIAQARRRGLAPVTVIDLVPETADWGNVLHELSTARADGVLTSCDMSTSARIVRQLRAAGIDAVFVGGDEIVCDEFAWHVGREPGTVLAIQPCHRQYTQSPAPLHGNGRLHDVSESPSSYAKPDDALSYDAGLHLLDAVQKAGRDRTAVRNVLHEMSAARLSVLRDGKWAEMSPPVTMRKSPKEGG